MTTRGDNGNEAPAGKRAGDARPHPALPKRFYRAVTVAPRVPSPLAGQGGGDGRTTVVGIPPTPNPSPRRVGDAPSARRGGGYASAFRILLDGKPARTPAKAELALPTRALADAIAAEWEAQGDRIDAATMPLTRIANSAIDGAAARLAKVCSDIVAFAGNDLLCYRAEGPEPLVQRQSEQWDPVLAWSRDALGARFEVAKGLMPIAQPEQATAAVATVLDGLDAFRLAALHVMTTLMGSALLALAHARGALTAEAAWAAAHVDEDWQISQWGEDAEAAARRARRWAEMQAASRMLALLA
jgi:chaperone required for assembly of F1-ATPase